MPTGHFASGLARHQHPGNVVGSPIELAITQALVAAHDGGGIRMRGCLRFKQVVRARLRELKRLVVPLDQDPVAFATRQQLQLAHPALGRGKRRSKQSPQVVREA